jgi:hypothetical protein
MNRKTTKKILAPVVALGALGAITVGAATSAQAGPQAGPTALKAGSVTSKTVKNQSLKSVDLAPDSVGSSEIRANAVGTSAIKDGSIGLRDLSDSAKANLKGQKGAPGRDGRAGQDGVTGYDIRNTEVRLTNKAGTVQVRVPDGKVALGGGYNIDSIRGGTAEIATSQPIYDKATGVAVGWEVKAVNVVGDVNLKVWVIAADVN